MDHYINTDANDLFNVFWDIVDCGISCTDSAMHGLNPELNWECNIQRIAFIFRIRKEAIKENNHAYSLFKSFVSDLQLLRLYIPQPGMVFAMINTDDKICRSALCQRVFSCQKQDSAHGMQNKRPNSF